MVKRSIAIMIVVATLLTIFCFSFSASAVDVGTILTALNFLNSLGTAYAGGWAQMIGITPQYYVTNNRVVYVTPEALSDIVLAYNSSDGLVDSTGYTATMKWFKPTSGDGFYYVHGISDSGVTDAMFCTLSSYLYCSIPDGNSAMEQGNKYYTDNSGHRTEINYDNSTQTNIEKQIDTYNEGDTYNGDMIDYTNGRWYNLVDSTWYDIDDLYYNPDNSTYTVNNEYEITYNYEYVYYNYIGTTADYQNKAHEFYYELDDGRSSADLQATDLASISVGYDILNYDRTMTDTYTRSLFHFDGNTYNDSFYDLDGYRFRWVKNASLTYLDSGVFGGSLYLDGLNHQFSVGGNGNTTYSSSYSYPGSDALRVYVYSGNAPNMNPRQDLYSGVSDLSAGSDTVWSGSGSFSSGSGFGGTFLNSPNVPLSSDIAPRKERPAGDGNAYYDYFNFINRVPFSVDGDFTVNFRLYIQNEGNYKLNIDLGGYGLYDMYNDRIVSSNVSFLNGASSDQFSYNLPFDKKYSLFSYDGSSGVLNCLGYTKTQKLSTGSWNDISIISSDLGVRLYVNGLYVVGASRSSISNYLNYDYLLFNVNNGSTSQSSYSSCQIDELRVLSFPEFTADYTPSPVPHDSNNVYVLPETDYLVNPTIAVQSKIPVFGYRIGGVRPTFPNRGLVYVSLEHGKATDVQIYTGSYWESVEARLWTGVRWVPLWSYNFLTLQDLFDMYGYTLNPGADVTTSEGFFSWFKNQWLDFRAWLSEHLGSGSSGSGGSSTPEDDDVGWDFGDFMSGFFGGLLGALRGIKNAASDLIGNIDLSAAFGNLFIVWSDDSEVYDIFRGGDDIWNYQVQ